MAIAEPGTKHAEPLPDAAGGEALARQLSALSIWLLVVNGMIGAGIFGVPAQVAGLTGAFSPFVFLLCGLAMVPVFLCFAEVASLFRNTGGPILYTRTAWGPLTGFLTGWALYVARLTAFAANLNLLVASLAWFWPAAAGGAVRVALMAAFCALLTWVNVAGARQAMRSVGVLTVLKFLPLVAVAVAGLAWLEPVELASSAANWPARGELGTAALLAIYAYVGWESALIPAGETREPSRDIPRALFWGLVIVTALYVLLQAVAIAVLPGLAASESPLVDVAAAIFGPAGALLITAGIVVSVGGNLAASLFSAPRMTYALARDGDLPAWFGVVHPGRRTPANSVVLYGVLVFLAASFGSFAWLAGMSALTRLAIYVLCIAALPRLRRLCHDAPGHLRLPGGWLLPGAAIAVCAWLLASVRLQAVLVTLGFLAVGAALRLVARQRAGQR